LVENSSDSIAIANLEGEGWYINEAGLKLVGFEGMELCVYLALRFSRNG
jgi:PAS domain-containing protein